MKQFLRESSRFISAEKISQEITKYFGDIGKAFDTCQVCFTSYIALLMIFILFNLQGKVVFHIDRDTSNISKVGGRSSVK
ncbi:hypothetical protein GYMLUDRAFT_701708 [Collybiopsis luxurians FD-317 M1]|uniref:Unplaced genomic scaffold GYMLUscaffold_38, whole genome shotgun sequence n=1 Tax=Collybiopsis luxurians FD-317 M1 TaxID=944289 RepID=A0A0D0C6Y0_9AGAR|nr:hypothetical protein GYMLUDRAFT_701708 [Collybiopsis luxurians FD-317 M1]